MSVDLHAAQIQGFFDGPVDHLFGKLRVGTPGSQHQLLIDVIA
jgi:phosphoribosylpyrophosphate synthetase